MDPQLIDSFSATGDDGQSTVQVWMTFHQIDGDMHDRRKKWIPDAFAAITTEAGEELYGIDNEEGRFGIQGSRTILTADESPAEIFAAFDTRYRALMGYGSRVPN